MTRRPIHDRDFHPVIFFQIVMAFLLLFLFFSACTSSRPATKEQKDVYLEKEIAETNQKIEEIYHRVSVIQFMVDNHEKALRDMEKSSTGNELSTETSPSPGISEAPIPSPDAKQFDSPETLYNEARKAFNDRDYNKAASLFSSFSSSYPNHDLADNAIYWNGECLYSNKDYEGAIKQFKHVISTYPDSNKMPDALLKTGYSFLGLKNIENAKTYLKKVARSYPFSPAASKAADMLKKIKD
ncbi:MAG: tol-pal system protein YbgF [Proteobacteria bacterium]|nr:tol-pal system protein YbgF [Pseudomonadota bacterium]